MKKDVKSCFQFINTFFLLDPIGTFILFTENFFRLLKISVSTELTNLLFFTFLYLTPNKWLY